MLCKCIYVPIYTLQEIQLQMVITKFTQRCQSFTFLSKPYWNLIMDIIVLHFNIRAKYSHKKIWPGNEKIFICCHIFSRNWKKSDNVCYWKRVCFFIFLIQFALTGT